MRKALFTIVVLLVLGMVVVPSSDCATIKAVLAFGMPATIDTNIDIFTPFGKLVEERSGGRIKVTVFPARQLMSHGKWVEALSAGTGEGFGIAAGPSMSKYDGGFLLTALPYLIDTEKEMWNFLHGQVGQNLLRRLESHNLVGLCWYVAGPGSEMAKIPILTIEDYKGKKVRSSGSPPEETFWRQCGASTVVVPTAEVYTAASQGLVNIVASGPNTWVANKWVEVLPYMYDRTVAYSFWPFVANKAWWDKLPADLQEICRKTARELCDKHSTDQFGYTANYIKQGEKMGGTYVKRTPEEVARFKKIATALWGQYEKDIGKELYNQALRDFGE